MASTDRTKDLICTGLSIVGVLLMITGWAMNASLCFWIALVVFISVFQISLISRSLTAIQFLSTVILSLVSIYNAFSHGGW
ncbi:cytochrome b subunit of formate dehydrogenase [Pseudomonas frederiksbergensis]|uniref:hypothetical protein n=1 Tax=Pseudomonas TaxID=286 RepID=UPI003D240807